MGIPAGNDQAETFNLYIFIIQVYYRLPQKITTDFQIIQNNFLRIMVKIVDLALTAVIDTFETYTINSLIKNNNSRLIFYVQSSI